MTILIDYDNLDRRERPQGVPQVITRLFEVLGPGRSQWESSVACRLYGGWLDGPNPSRDAKRLLSVLRRRFPRFLPVAHAGVVRSVLVHVELARSLACDPGTVLTHTHRRRSFPRTLRCAPAPFAGCAGPATCPVVGLEEFIRDDACPVARCPVEPRAVFTRAEQKLVDSMLVLDLVHFAETTDQPLVLVSGDEDFWPAIRFVLLRGIRIIHVVPRRTRTDRERYRGLETATYSRIVM